MQGKQLKEAISILYDMELNNYMMTRSIQQLEDEAVKMGQERYIEPPKKMFNFVSIGEYVKAKIPAIIISAIAIIVVGLIIFFVLAGDIVGTKKGEMAFTLAFPAIVMCAQAVVLILIISGVKSGSAEKARNQAYIDSIHEKEMQQYNAALQQEKDRVYKITEGFRSQCTQLETRKAEATTNLNKYYDAVGIDHLFRNIIPIGYMYDLIRLGVSDKLEGPKGLNYLVRQDLRADEFHHTLEEISAKMDIIINTQRAIYYELQSINEQCSRLVSESVMQTQLAINSNETLEQIRNNTAISAYNSGRIRKENEYANTLHTFEFYRK